MNLDYTICTGMCGNGVVTSGIQTMKERREMLVRGRKSRERIMRMIIILGCCVVVAGTAILITAVPRFATAMLRAAGTASMSVFGLCAALRGFFSEGQGEALRYKYSGKKQRLSPQCYSSRTLRERPYTKNMSDDRDSWVMRNGYL